MIRNSDLFRPERFSTFCRGSTREILIAACGGSIPLVVMGAKYLPTIKDQKASQRFQQRQSPMPPLKKTARHQPVRKGKKK